MTSPLPAKVTKGRVKLMLRHPYLASATAALKFRSVASWLCPTMGTDGFNILINPDFVSSLSDDEVIGVIAHEVMHCVLGHPDRRKARDPEVWNVAVDFATNLILSESGFVLPGDALLDWSYKGQTAEEIYDELVVDQKSGGQSSTTYRLIETRENGGFSDLHIDPQSSTGLWARDAHYPSEAERIRLRDVWCKELRTRLPGKSSADYIDEIEGSVRRTVDWRALLSKFVTGLRRDDYRMFPFNKKHVWRDVLLPSLGNPGPEHLIVVIDTSGSMDNELLGRILGELDALRASAGCRLTLIQCDAEIKTVESYEAWETTFAVFDQMEFLGRGGTDLRPPFQWVADRVSEGGSLPDALVYLTDGFGEAPTLAPGFPCLWVVPNHGRKIFPYGETIVIDV